MILRINSKKKFDKIEYVTMISFTDNPASTLGSQDRGPTRTRRIIRPSLARQFLEFAYMRLCVVEARGIIYHSARPGGPRSGRSSIISLWRALIGRFGVPLARVGCLFTDLGERCSFRIGSHLYVFHDFLFFCDSQTANYVIS